MPRTEAWVFQITVSCYTCSTVHVSFDFHFIVVLTRAIQCCCLIYGSVILRRWVPVRSFPRKMLYWSQTWHLPRPLSMGKRNYSATEKVCYEGFGAIITLRQYLQCTHLQVRTEHNASKWMTDLKDPQGRLTNRLLRLMQFYYELVYRSTGFT